ncbi:hypothetical protein HAX54_010614 [Datura stramonium]|uniref:Uncharacterized protein n=1 Tax=Datura stramonium TaxID=4076 RepID=A0ABS8TI06_DATST|nr:hypothetical protein [Datura stramonium]
MGRGRPRKINTKNVVTIPQPGERQRNIKDGSGKQEKMKLQIPIQDSDDDDLWPVLSASCTNGGLGVLENVALDGDTESDHGRKRILVNAKLIQKRPHIEVASRVLVEETIVKQQSRVQWLKLGDANTVYFYACFKSRSSQNHITRLQSYSISAGCDMIYLQGHRDSDLLRQLVDCYSSRKVTSDRKVTMDW